MRPVFDPRLFPGLPKFLWFDDGSSSDGGGGGNAGPGGDASATGGGTGASTGVGSGAAPGTSTSSADAAASGMGGVGSAGQAASVGGQGSVGFGGGVGGTDAGGGQGFGAGQTSVSVNAPGTPTAGGVTDAAAANMGFATGGGGSGRGGGAATGGGSTGGPGAATGAGGTGGPGAATGGGGGTAAGGSGISASVRAALQNLLGGNPADALRGAVRNSQLDFGGGGATTGVPSLGVPEGVGGPGAAPTGVVTVSPLGPPSPNLVSLAQQLFGSSAAQAARGAGSSTAAPDNLGPAMALLRGGLQAQQGGMGFPSIEGVSPGLTAAPAGPTQGYPSVIGPAGPNGPSAFASNADNAPGGQTSGLGAAAPTSAAVSSPASPNAPPTQPDIGGLLQLVLSLVLGGNPGPQLPQLAQAARSRPQLAQTSQAG
jgi:hypothetical protein